jgi:DNA-binding MarR family transcriptional regulator
MAEATQDEDSNSARIVLGLLESVERDGGQSQRRLASDLGIALGLVNAYLKRCVKKGLVKVSEAPARRYMYYLTPQGFAEKSRLTVEYLSHSFGFFRQAKSDCLAEFQNAAKHGLNRVVLVGHSDLAEIAVICAMECAVEVVAIVGSPGEGSWFGRPAVSAIDEVQQPFDAIMITDLVSTRASYEAASAKLNANRVLVPQLLRAAASAVQRSQQ